MRRPSLSSLAAVAAFALLVAFGWPLYHYWRWATAPRTITVSTPSQFARAVETDVRVRAGEKVCLSPVALTPRTQAARISAERRVRAPQPLELTASGPGYRSTATLRRWEHDGTFEIRFRPPERELLGRVCIRNRGADAVFLSGTNELRRSGRAETFRDGTLLDAHVALVFVEPRPVAFVDRLPAFLDRIAVWQAPWMGGAVLWILLVLVLAGIPIATALAFAWSAAARPDDAGSPRRGAGDRGAGEAAR